MSSETAIRIQGLSKSYKIRHEHGHKPTNLAEAITHRIRRPFQRSNSEEFWALKDIDLEIKAGEVVGIIGRNGAGKSTLLKVLSRITEPTEGRVELFGRVGSLLEVGTGFHPELTGRENIFLNGSILGMKRPEITRQFEAIVDFAGIEKFLDTPVKRFSSGMYVRLAFAVAAHLNPEILIVDEVLAVGDAEFQKKCLGKMEDVARSGRTVLFVSHNIAAVRTLCHKGLLLNRGQVDFSGPIGECIDQYIAARSEAGRIINHTSKCHPSVAVERIMVNGSESDRVHLPSSVRELHVEMSGQIRQATRGDIQVRIHDSSGLPLGIFSPAFEEGYAEHRPEGPFHIKHAMQLPRLNKGEYSLMFELVIPNVAAIYEARDAVRISADGTTMKTGQTFHVNQQLGCLLLDRVPR